MPLRWRIKDINQWPLYCPVHVDEPMERQGRIHQSSARWAMCGKCIKDMLTKLAGEGFHESRQIKKQRREREQRE